MNNKMYKSFFKRILDFSCALIGLILLSPLLIVITISLHLVNKGDPFFFQLRPGKHGAIFKIIKFKTMNDKKDEEGKLLPDADRLTRIGAFVRKTSLDEIPQLFNVIKGDMSLIGPRPLLPQYLPLYNEFQKRRHEVKPGITGWAQVNGRNGITWDEQFEFDVAYVDRISLTMDFKIFLMTFLSVFKKSGIYSHRNFRTFYFEGNDKYREYGSDFCYYQEEQWSLADSSNSFFNENAFSLFFSGRSALLFILQQGIKNHGWEKVFFPSYYCQEVAHFIKNLPIQVEQYEFNPFLDSESKKINIEDNESHVIVNVDFFGLKKLDVSSFQEAMIIDDQTHHILQLKNSKADYCFGSLRKELPIPMGGFCYSPKGYALPNPKYSSKCEELAVQKLSAMFLKKKYLDGSLGKKDLFITLFAEVENDLEANYTNSKIPNIAKSILYQLDIEKILAAKRSNLDLALELLTNCENIKVNFGSKNHAFGLILECNSSEERNRLKLFLIKKNIFPAVLWPGQTNQRDKEIENKILFLHVDYRYSTEDIRTITATLKWFFNHD